MEKFTLKNGMTVLFEPKPTASVAVEVLVKTGSNNEAESVRGVSHVVEHMLFEGTKKRKSSKEIANLIEKIGGELNAYTSSERTGFYIKVLSRHFALAVDVLADIIQNPLFKARDLFKEKKIILKEIDVVNDEPRYYQWILFQKTLYEKHPARHPPYGSKETVSRLTKRAVLNYYCQYYHPQNLIVSVVGNVRGVKELLEKKFTFKRQGACSPTFSEGPSCGAKEKREKREVVNSYLVYGFKAVPRNHPDSYALDVINSITGRGQSGTLFQEIRAKRGLAYEVNTQYAAEKDFGYFAVYLSTDKKNIPQIKALIRQQLKKLLQVTENELQEAKDYLEGSFSLDNEDTLKQADLLAYWEMMGEGKLAEEYVKRIKAVSRKDVREAVKKYLSANPCVVVLEGK